jgi:hypothetical protein
MPFHDRVYAEVTDNGDPEQRRRVRVRCPALVRADSELPFWIAPMSLGRLFDVPAVGERVELLVIAGRSDTQEFARLDVNSARWAPAFRDKDDVIPQEVLDNYNNAVALWTPDGSFAMLDKETGAIAIAKPDGSRMDIDADGVITVTHKDGSTVTIDDAVINLAHKGGDSIELDGTNIKLSGSCLLGAGTYFLVRGDKLVTFLASDKIWKDTHVHSGVMPGPGSTAVAVPPSGAVPTDLNSTTQKTE